MVGLSWTKYFYRNYGQFLLTNAYSGLDVNAINKFGNTALHEALLNDINTVAIASLLKHKADMNIQNKYVVRNLHIL